MGANIINVVIKKRNVKLILIVAIILARVFADLSSLDATNVINGSARSLGMGGAFLNIQNDPSVVFSNPAGVGSLKETKFFFMNTKTLQEVDYLIGGVTFPLQNIGTVGLSLLSRSSGDIPLTNPLTPQQLNDPSMIDFDDIKKGSYTENTFLITYANEALLFRKNIRYGLNTKFFQKTLSGYDEGSASALNFDAGIQFSLNRDLDIAVKLQNIIGGANNQASAGSLLWDTGESESISSYLICGIANKTLYRNVLLALDLKKDLSRDEYPVMPSFGLEWHPLDYLFLRLGLWQSLEAPDADSGGGKMLAVNNFSVGTGVNLFGWRFDYAYLPNSEIKDLSTHLFSISYVGAEPSERATALKEDLVTASALMELYSPTDRTITDSVVVNTEGKIYRGNRYILNGEEYLTNKNGNFTKEIVLALGINDITLAIPESNETIVRKVLRMAAFDDIEQSRNKNAITNLATLGYIQGDYPRKFNPDRYVSRSEMATLVIKINRFMVPLSMKGIWDDVDILASQGILKGFPDGLMKQDEKLTRAQAAMVLARLQGLPTQTADYEYSYLAAAHWAEPAIKSLMGANLYTRDDFTPYNDYITKEELVDLFSRLSSVQQSIDKLLNFDETGMNDNFNREINTVFMRRAVTEQDKSDLEIFNEMVDGPMTTLPVNNPSVADVFDYQETIHVAAQQGLKSPAGASLPLLSVMSPADKSVLYGATVTVKGTLSNGHKVLINGQQISLINGQFEKNVALKEGKNIIVVKAFNKEGKYVRLERRLIKLKRFTDINESDPNYKLFAEMAALGIISGDSSGRFSPAKKITKIEYAGMLNNLYGLNKTVPNISPYKDLSVKHWGYRNAVILDQVAILKADDGYYKPDEKITRAFGLVILARAENLNIPTNVSGKVYADVDNTVWAYKHIYAAKKIGLIDDAKYFRPFEELDRRTAVVFLSKTKKVKEKMSKLYNWQEGF